MAEELYSHGKATMNFQTDLKGKMYFFGDIAVLTFESLEDSIARLVNSEVVSIVTEREEYARFLKQRALRHPAHGN